MREKPAMMRLVGREEGDFGGQVLGEVRVQVGAATGEC